VRVDRAIERLAGVAADRVEELRASEDAARLARQRRNQLKLRGREIDRGACAGDREAIRVEEKIPEVKLGAGGFVSAARRAPGTAFTRAELARAESLVR
jgi:hypothetical protein